MIAGADTSVQLIRRAPAACPHRVVVSPRSERTLGYERWCSCLFMVESSRPRRCQVRYFQFNGV